MKFNSVEQTLLDENRKLKNENKLLRENSLKGTFTPGVVIPMIIATLIIGGCLGMTIASEVIGGMI